LKLTKLLSVDRASFQLKLLDEADLRRVLEQALADPERGYGQLSVIVEPDAIAHLVNVANGDARSLLNALELAVETTPPDETGTIHVTLAVAEESIQQRAVLYDKEGDAHFDTISAFIKSLRGSDPDAALYWLAKMVYAGEDPRFIFRRMLILASEDVGLADPNAVVVVNACASAFEWVGMPEGRYHLAQATLYLANAPKSNSVMGFFDALAVVEKEREARYPITSRMPTGTRKGWGMEQVIFILTPTATIGWLNSICLVVCKDRCFINLQRRGLKGKLRRRWHVIGKRNLKRWQRCFCLTCGSANNRAN
jgi:putative ATPase